MHTHTPFDRIVGHGGRLAVAVLGALALLAPPGWSQTADPGGLVVDKQVDADGDGAFGDVEDAHSSTSPVTFRVTLANTTADLLQVTSVVDVLGEARLDLLAEPACADLATSLDRDQAVTCTFTLDRYLRTWASQPRNVLTNRVEAIATVGETTVGGSDEATVRNPNATQVSVAVDLTSDADGDGVFTDDEEAPHAGADVPVQAVVRNTSPGAVVITGLSGAWGGADIGDDLLADCPELDGIKLWGVGGGDHDGGEHEDGTHTDEPDGHDGGHARPSSATCSTTLVGHAPPDGAALTDTVTATVGKKHSPERTATASDTTRVWVAAPEPGEPSAPARPAMVLELRVGSEAGVLGDHDAPPGPTIAVPAEGARVRFVLRVSNTGNTTLVDVGLAAGGLDLGACVLPDMVAPGQDLTCTIAPVAADVGPQVFLATATATGAGTLVEATDLAHYLGVAVAGEQQAPTPAPAPTRAPTPAPAPTMAPAPAPVTPATATLPATGLPGGVASGLVSVLAGIALLTMGRSRPQERVPARHAPSEGSGGPRPGAA